MTTRTRAPRAETDAPRAGDRIAKLLARAGIASRREVERMIADGRVAIDGVALDTPATVLTSLAGVTVDGTPVQAATPTRLFLYHKPPGLLVTERDPKGRPTIYDRLPDDLPRVVPVGRLDLATEGLLLLTTDGGFKRQLELPSTGVERAYRARAYGQVTQGQLEDLAEGVEIEGVRYGSIDANIERRTGANVWIELILTEGKNREVRRVLEHLDLQVSRLIRTRYGPFVLGDLGPGQVGEVGGHDLAGFRRALGDVRHGRARGDGPDATIAVEARVKPPVSTAAGRPSAPRTPPADGASAGKPARAGDRGRSPRTDGRDPGRPGRGDDARAPAAVAPPARGVARPDRAPSTDRPGKSSRPARPAGSTRIRADGTAASDKPPRSTRPAPGKGPAGGRGRPSKTPRTKR